MGKKTTTNATPSLFDAEETLGRGPCRTRVPAADRSSIASWLEALAPETRQPYWNELQQFVAAERAAHTVYPPAEDVFNAFRYTPLDEV